MENGKFMVLATSKTL